MEQKAVESTPSQFLKEKIQTLNEEAFALRFTDFQQALHLAETSLALIGDNPDLLAEKAFALNAKGIAHYTLGDDANAVDCFQESLRLARVIDDKEKEAAFLCSIGIVHLRRQETEAAISLFEASLALCQKFGFSKTEAVVLNNLGNAFIDQKRFADALACHEKRLNAKEKMNDERGENCLFGKFSLCAFGVRQFGACIRLANQGRAIAEKLGEKCSMATVYLNLGKVYAKRNS